METVVRRFHPFILVFFLCRPIRLWLPVRAQPLELNNFRTRAIQRRAKPAVLRYPCAVSVRARDTDSKAPRPEHASPVAPAEERKNGLSLPHVAACWVYGLALRCFVNSFSCSIARQLAPLFNIVHNRQTQCTFLHVRDLMSFIESSRTIAKCYLTL